MVNIKKTNKEITRELNRIENALNRKLQSFYNSKIKGSPQPTEVLRSKYNTTVRNMIRQTVQASYLYGSKLVSKQISDITTEFIEFISVTDVQNIQSTADKVTNQFWKTADRLHRRETEFTFMPGQDLVPKPEFDTTAAIIGLSAFATFLGYNTAILSKMEIINTPIELGIGEGLVQLGEFGEPSLLGLQGQVMFLTQEDALVDPDICEPLNRMVYDVAVDVDIPQPPLHNHCRCRLIPIVDETEII